MVSKKTKHVPEKKDVLMVVRRAIPAVLASFLVPALVFAVTTIGTNISTDGTLTTNGSTTLGDDATADTVTLNARFASTMNPSTNNARDLGAFGTAWRDIYASSSLRVGGSSASSTLSSNGNFTLGGVLQSDSTTGTSTFAGALGVGTTTPANTLSIGHTAATGTVFIGSSGSRKGGCLQLQSPTGAAFRLYATTTGFAVFESGTCQ